MLQNTLQHTDTLKAHKHGQAKESSLVKDFKVFLQWFTPLLECYIFRIGA